MRLKPLLLVCVLGASCASQQALGRVTVPIPPPPRPIPELVEQLAAPDAPSRAAAAWALAGAGSLDATAIQALLVTLADPSEPVREAATWALSHVTGPGFEHRQLTDIPPKALVITRPNYPRDAFDKKTQGTVLVEILINALGMVTHAEIRGSLPGLNEAALACVRDWRFEPARRAGVPVPAMAQAPIGFRIY